MTIYYFANSAAVTISLKWVNKYVMCKFDCSVASPSVCCVYAYVRVYWCVRILAPKNKLYSIWVFFFYCFGMLIMQISNEAVSWNLKECTYKYIHKKKNKNKKKLPHNAETSVIFNFRIMCSLAMFLEEMKFNIVD